MTKEAELEVVVGEDFDAIFWIADRNTGTFVDWTVGTWQVRADVRDRKGKLLARMANYGTRDGDITLLDEGRLKLHLPASKTSGLPQTRVYTNDTDVRVVGWRHRRPLFFDVKATETVSSDRSVPIQGRVVVSQPVSA